MAHTEKTASTAKTARTAKTPSTAKKATARKTVADKTTAKLRITYIKSVIGYSQRQRDTITSLGLRRLHQSVEHTDTPEIRGMVNKVSHLVRVEEVAG